MRSLKRILGLLVCIVLVCGLIAPAMAVPSKVVSLEEANRAIALRFAKDGWGTEPQWEAVWDALVSPKMVQHFNSFPDPIVGRDANKEFNVGLFQGFPNIRQKIETVMAEGDNVIYRTTIEGTQTGDFLGIPPTNKKVKVDDFTQLRIQDGQIMEMWYTTNLLEVMKQLGIMKDLG